MFGHKRSLQDPCKHIVAVIYKLTAAIDEDAGQLFLAAGRRSIARASHISPAMRRGARQSVDPITLGGSGDGHSESQAIECDDTPPSSPEWHGSPPAQS